jgi:fumarate reductase iron-sulfur subunit
VQGTTLEVRIWRGGDEGAFSTYAVPVRANQTVLDVVTEVQRRFEPSLAYRFSCRVGVCGSCAMTVNGKPRWTCRTHVKRVADEGTLTIEPLRHMKRVKDLTCDMDTFFEKWTEVGVFEGTTTRADPPAAIAPESAERQAADAAIQCINCAVCYAACDVVGWDANYLGPAALNRAWTLVNDARVENRGAVLERAMGEGGCHSCHSHGACMEACPVGLSPTQSIVGLKRQAFWTALRGGR